MNQRQTFDNSAQLLDFVTAIADKEQRAFLLIDNEGLTRAEGIITSINEEDDIENTGIVLNDRDTVTLKEIIGINGLFRSDYSEC
jgi:hypothetical protein